MTSLHPGQRIFLRVSIVVLIFSRASHAGQKIMACVLIGEVHVLRLKYHKCTIVRESSGVSQWGCHKIRNRGNLNDAGCCAMWPLRSHYSIRG